MDRRRIAILLLAVTAGIGLAYLVPAASVKTVLTVIMALFGALTGFLVNLMMRTAQALEGQGLGAGQLRELSDLLARQQRGWRSLFYVYLVVISVLIIGGFLPSEYKVIILNNSFDLIPIWVGFLAAVIVIAIARSQAMLSGIEALQSLRSKLLIDAAERREKQEREKAVSEVSFRPGASTPGYGRIVDFPNQ